MLETEQAYGRSEEASKASETENQLVHLQKPSVKRLTIKSSQSHSGLVCSTREVVCDVKASGNLASAHTPKVEYVAPPLH